MQIALSARTLLLLFACALLPAGLFAQQGESTGTPPSSAQQSTPGQTPPTSDTPVIRTTSRIVILDTVVLDKRGNVVTSLSAKTSIWKRRALRRL